MKKGHFNHQELDELIALYSSEVRKLSFQLQISQETLDDLKKQQSAASQSAPKATVEKVTATETSAPAEAPAAKVKAKDKVKAKAKAPAAKDAPKKGRGRPRKEKPTENGTTVAETAPKRKRGRPKKEETIVAAEVAKPVKATKGKKKATTELRSLADEQSKPQGYRLSEWDIFILNTLKSAKKVMISADLMKKAKAKVRREKLDIDDQTLNGKLNRSIHKLVNKRMELVKADYPGRGNGYGLPEWRDESGEIQEKYMADLQ